MRASTTDPITPAALVLPPTVAVRIPAEPPRAAALADGA